MLHRALLLSLVLLAGCDGRDSGADEVRDGRADRIITLAPHLAELVHAAGAGDKLVGTVEYSEHPPAARSLPRVGDAFRVDPEAIAVLRPDLILGWPSGNSPEVLEGLEGLGHRVVALEPRSLDDIAIHLRLIGRMAGTPVRAGRAAQEYERRLDELRRRHAHRRTLRVFYQISAEPLMTVGAGHFIGQAMSMCGAVNVFADTGAPAFVVETEAVLAASPDVIIASRHNPGVAELGNDELARWRRWSDLPAVAGGQLHVIDAGLLTVPGPRLPDGIRQLCRLLDGARESGAASGLPEHLGAAVGTAGQSRTHEQQV